ncbi:muconolactone Delta-isomerase [Acinetobacter baumannii]|uniref:muconolactone Delta-isomerase n=1 Tax=Acinetobacter calcoaceticus/baumannii complex TaxID=909768 RepID=UPI0002BC70F8|nr:MULTISPECIES: muconolactone Delta-isomerase [Acinetobacter calcoaceticus/baumannii complex]MCU4414438.1 muconolactone Delta-isomerase [Acinetobacter sp. WU_MDCI_Axc73]EHU2952580.1 muconolactone Delta-isomerase [Acinetobacter baumannii]EHZ7970144.1 muconolactone Delta-isomerase [Acinetobacter baumannii]EIO2226576.1 muconolactone Delta-isomerase [Acinetobacter baumannii]EJD6089160.1 muconolactone Delta-isomerase [Acinetobacter baumannii]
MLFYVRKDVILPSHLTEQEIEDIKARERAYSQEIQRQGKCRHLWRITGQYANISIFDVESNEELHNLLQGLPLYPYMKIEVIALNRHPSSVREGDF